MANRHSGNTAKHDVSSPLVGRSLHRPVPSPNGHHMAVIVPELELHILNLLEPSSGNRIARVFQFPQSVRAFLPNVDIVRWSPETLRSEDNESTHNDSLGSDPDQTWLLLAGDRRLIVLCIDLSEDAMIRQVDADYKQYVLCDLEFPEHHGKITTADFVSSHRHAFLSFEMNLHGSLVSFVEAERHDIKGVKFSSEQGFAKDPSGRYFAFLRREHGQDQACVFDLSQDDLTPTTFATGLIDTQGIRWSPDGRPVLLMWESPAFGSQIKFFTALGHPLQPLDMKWGFSTANALSLGVSGAGVTALAWSKQGGSSTHTVLAVGDGNQQVCFRCQKTQSLSVSPETVVAHHESVSSSECTIWQESSDQQFQKEEGVLEMPADANQDVEIVSISADGAMFATKLSSAPRVAWIWQAEQVKPAFVIFFRDDIKQLLWHPTLAGILVIVPKSRSPIVHTWYDKVQPLLTCSLPTVNANTNSSWRGGWIRQRRGLDNESQVFLLSSTKQFQIGHLGVAESRLCFESIFDQDPESSEETTMMLDTPSKPSRRENNVMNGHRKPTVDPDTYWFTRT